jgi:hypothetical protein
LRGWHCRSFRLHRHPDCSGRRFQYHQLVTADPGAAISQRAGKGRGQGGQRGITAIEDNEIVAEAMHLDERNAHGQRLKRWAAKRPV